MKRYSHIIGILSPLVILVALMVMVGWFMDITVLKSIHPGWVSMKFITAASFLMCGLTMFFIQHYLDDGDDLSQILISVLSLLVSLLMLTMLVSSLLGVRSGIEDLFVREAPGTINTSVPGRPAIITILNFISISSIGFIALIRPKYLTYWFIVAGSLVLMSGLLALFGYFLNIPILYFSIPGFSSAMAIHTSFLFVLLGFQAILLGEPLAHSPLRKK